jgi:uncharacterized protein (TIGR00661 family)
MNNKLQCKVYLSDEGYGHIVRQSAILEGLLKLMPETTFTVQTHKHLDAVSRIIPGVDTIDKFNNISWQKKANGSPDVPNIKIQFNNYLEDSERYIAEELDLPTPDFILSDLVYEAFEIGAIKSIPAFGVAHFTWDWFFSKLYPPPLTTSVMDRFFAMAMKSKTLYFPPFTPEEILVHYKKNSMEVPLILRSEILQKRVDSKGKFKVMIIDSGAGVLSKSVKKALHQARTLDDYEFYVSSKFRVEQANVSFIDEHELLVDYIGDMDLVIGRAGFNTISECIGLRTPMLLLGEAMNPEMNENIITLKKQHLGSFISMETFENEIDSFLPSFIAHEYKFIAESMRNHTIATNGADVIAKDIQEKLA